VSLYTIAGGGGFIGSNIVEQLLRDGEDVRVLDNFATGPRVTSATTRRATRLWPGSIM
jgi:nucleoside-diphosphate-sugar epimerase